MTTRIYLLIKVFDKEEYADAFIQKGDLFCRTPVVASGVNLTSFRGLLNV